LSVELRLQVPFHLSVSAAQQAATRAKLRVLSGSASPSPSEQERLRIAEVSIALDAERPEYGNEGGHEYSGDLVVGGRVNPSLHQLMRPSHEIVADVRAAIVAGGCGSGGAPAPSSATPTASAAPAASGGLVWGLSHANVHWRTVRQGDATDAGIGEGGWALLHEPELRAFARTRRSGSGGGEGGRGGGGDGHAQGERGGDSGSFGSVGGAGRFVGDGAVVEASLIIDPDATVREAHRHAVRVRHAVLSAVPDVAEVDLHLELFERDGTHVRSPADLPASARLPPLAEAEARLRGKRVAAKLRRTTALGGAQLDTFPCDDSASCGAASR